MKRKGVVTRNKTIGYGWTGRWVDGSPGWFMPRFVHGGSVEPAIVDSYCAGETCYLVRVTVEVVKDKRGRLITRRFPRP